MGAKISVDMALILLCFFAADVTILRCKQTGSLRNLVCI